MQATDRDFAVAQSIVRNRFPEFTFPILILPRTKRRAVAALIAFCDLIQRSLEESTEIDASLELLRQRLTDIYADHLELPRTEFREPEQAVLAAAGQTLRKYSVPMNWLEDFAQDIATAKRARRYATWPSLQKHCESTGATIALMLATVLGIQNSQAWEGIRFVGL